MGSRAGRPTASCSASVGVGQERAIGVRPHGQVCGPKLQRTAGGRAQKCHGDVHPPAGRHAGIGLGPREDVQVIGCACGVQAGTQLGYDLLVGDAAPGIKLPGQRWCRCE